MKNALPLLLFPLLSVFHPSLNAQCDFTEVIITTTTVNWGEEVSWKILDEEDNLLADFEADADNSTYETTICLPDGCYLLHAMDSYGDGWNGGYVNFNIEEEVVEYALENGEEGLFAFGVNTTGCVVEIPGCTDPNAVNYNPLATIDDGSCTTIEGILEQQNITFLLESGPKDNRINWAIQNRGMPNPNNAFDSEEQFVMLLQDGILQTFTPGSMLEKEPYARYRNFFNLYAWWWPDAPSQETGWSWQILKGIRDSYFLPWADEEHGWATLFSISRTGGGGGAGVQPDTRTGDGLMFGTGWETLLHEFGHTMPQVPDEYSASGEWSNGNCWESANTTAFTVKDSIPWRNWIATSTELPTPYKEDQLDNIGAFEGALTNFFGCHRPTARGCYMGAGGFGEGYGNDLCPPCRQRVICHLYKYVDVIENPVPTQTNLEVSGNQSITFSAEIVKPEPNTQVYTWLLNGKVIAYGTESVEVSFGHCDQYELTLTVEDTTSWVRYDEHFDHIYPRPFESHTWQIEQTDIEEDNLNVVVNAENADCTGEATGSIEFNITGGTAPYSAIWEGEDIGLQHEALLPGVYQYWLVDANHCGERQEVIIEASNRLEVDVCTDFNNGWNAAVIVNGYDPNTLTYDWSNGSTTAQQSGLQNGNYTVSVTTPEACTVTQTIDLTTPEAPLMVDYQHFPSSLDENNGSAYLNIIGGQPSYSIRWYEKKARDLTAVIFESIDASGTNFDHFPEYAFDDDLFTKWLQLGDSGLWLRFHFPEGQVIQHYTVTSGDDVPSRDPKDWQVEGSMDGLEWEVLDIRQEVDFPERRQRKGFELDNNSAYHYYRFYVLANSGADAIQLQELEFIGLDPQEPFKYNPNADNKTVRQGLAPGAYQYLVQDENSSCDEQIINIQSVPEFMDGTLQVVQQSSCQVTIANPQTGFDYYWLADETGAEILGIGQNFRPPAGGNYWVAAVSPTSGAMSSNRTGFAVSMPSTPVVEETEEGILGVVNPEDGLVYYWYDAPCEGTLVHEGTTFTPGPGDAEYWVAAWWAEPFPEAIEPTEIPGMILRMDAADLDGDGELDNPAPISSSLYDWSFTPSNGWSDGSWFAFRGNQQNGLGVADFATIWYQCLQEGFSDYQTVIMAYQENALSWQGSAPFFGLDDLIPYSAAPDQQLYSDDAPATTLNGLTYLNGQESDPLNTPNPLEFSILAQTFTQPAGWTNCTDTHWEGKVGEILFYEQELNEEQLVGISEYLRRKWISTADLESQRTSILWEDGISSASEVDQVVELLVAPNPAGNHASLLIKNNASQVVKATLFNAFGQPLFQTSIAAEQQILKLDTWLYHLPQGIYTIRVLTDSGIQQSIAFIKT